jgi:hypothetical protein
MELDSFFRSYEEFALFVKKIVENKKRAQRILEHEKSHFRKARELGYHPIYFAKDYGREYGFQVVIPGEISPEHQVLIALAPENPSERDFALARECGGMGEK